MDLVCTIAKTSQIPVMRPEKRTKFFTTRLSLPFTLNIVFCTCCLYRNMVQLWKDGKLTREGNDLFQVKYELIRLLTVPSVAHGTSDSSLFHWNSSTTNRSSLHSFSSTESLWLSITASPNSDGTPQISFILPHCSFLRSSRF